MKQASANKKNKTTTPAVVAQPKPVGRQLVVLVVVDIVIFLLFATLGRASHAESLPLLGIAQTAAPFLLAWLAVAPMLGAYRPALLADPLPMAIRTFTAWVAACVLGLFIRSAWLQRDIILSFALVTFGVLTVLLVGWRTAFAWWNRSHLT